MKRPPLYIETKIDCEFDLLWEHTQNPHLHQLWDLRFSEIDYLPKEDPTEPQRFNYRRKIFPGICVHGIGESVATKANENGESTSVLKFGSSSPVSLIEEGSGYWKYLPDGDGIRFLTGYNYKTRWGSVGKIVDKLIFRPLMVRATAWSFDCLKNWLEKNIHPREAINSQITVSVCQLVLALVWIYHGIIPKMLFPHHGELREFQKAGFFVGHEIDILILVGIAEVLFGLILLLTQSKWVHYINIVGLSLLLTGSVLMDVNAFTWPFNPVTFNISLIALSIITLLHLNQIPRYKKCKMRQK